MKSVTRRFCFLTLFLAGIVMALSGCSNTNDYEVYGTITGCVTDAADGMPLYGATVVLSPMGVSSQTDASGIYEFTNLEPRQYTIIVQKQGYQPNRRTVTAITGEKLTVDVQLTVIPQ